MVQSELFYVHAYKDHVEGTTRTQNRVTIFKHEECEVKMCACIVNIYYIGLHLCTSCFYKVKDVTNQLVVFSTVSLAPSNAAYSLAPNFGG